MSHHTLGTVSRALLAEFTDLLEQAESLSGARRTERFDELQALVRAVRRPAPRAEVPLRRPTRDVPSRAHVDDNAVLYQNEHGDGYTFLIGGRRLADVDHVKDALPAVRHASSEHERAYDFFVVENGGRMRQLSHTGQTLRSWRLIP